MLNSIDLSDKTYEDILSDAIARIPLYSAEWTNYNVSDPGITVLQNFSAFSLLQQSHINTVDDRIRLRLLKLLGYTPRRTHAAQALLAPEAPLDTVLPAHHKLYVGKTCFETMQETRLHTWRMEAAYAVQGERVRDISYQLDRTLQAAAAVFGEQPVAGNALVCILDGDITSGMELLFYVEVQDEKRRNLFEDDRLLFAKTVWQYYTEDGWKTCQAEDTTRALLCSGQVRLRLGEEAPAVLRDYAVQGLAVRCLLSQADYDIAPRVSAVSANLFPVAQKDTRAACFCFAGNEEVRIFSDMTSYENLFVFCRESAEDVYYAYRMEDGQSEYGRFYRATQDADGALRLTFDKAGFGYGPSTEGPDAVRVICYEGETLLHRSLGTVFGYEEQEMDIEQLENILPEGFCVLAETLHPDGPATYRFLEPGEKAGEEICFSLLSAPGKLQITRMDAVNVCHLYLANCAVTAGAGGNIRAGSHLAQAEDPYRPSAPQTFISPGPGRGGVSEESAEQLRQRFVRELKRCTSAVTTQDYEALVRRTPGLCIDKVRAVSVPESNLVRLTVKPFSQERFPALSETYRRQIMQYLEPRRMITTRFELRQPQYVPIDVRARVYVKSYYENIRSEIEALIERELDFVSGAHTFGETVSFTELYRKLEDMQGVEGVYALSLEPGVQNHVTRVGEDVQLGESCLCYLGNLTLEISTFQAH